MVISAPPVRRRLVGHALRRYRQNLGYSLEDAARILECDRSKVSRIETGDRGIRARELRELLNEYGIRDEQLDILILLADPRAAFGWHRDYQDVLPEAWNDYVTLETAAPKIWGYEAQRIPALLQTPAYAQALAQADRAFPDDDARDRAVQAVMARQHAILNEHQPEIRLVIGQAALHQEIGGPQVMNEQLRHLARQAAGRSPVTLQLLSFGSGAHTAAGDGSFAVLQFTGTAGLGLVHVGAIAGGVCREDRAAIVAYAEAFDQLRAFAHTPAQSAQLLRTLTRA